MKEVDPIARWIPQPVIDDVKAHNELVALVGQYVRLEKKSGSNLFGLCPFHDEKTPSFSVSASKQIFYCFGCHKGGDAIRFIMEIEKMSYPDAIRHLADRAGIRLPQPDDAAWQARETERKRLQTLYLEAARFFYHNLNAPQGAAMRRYLAQRQLQPATITRFGLGYAPEGWDGLLKHLNSLGFTDQAELLRSGLFKRSKHGTLYDLFRDRLMFPVFDALGRLIAFGGRVIDDAIPKYINSPETPLYQKGRHCYGLNLAKSSKAKALLVAEGYLDVLMLHQAGFKQAVAALGTALTEQQARLLRQYTDQVVIAYDADAAGQAAALRSLDLLAQKDLTVRVLQLPDGEDPDSFLKAHGPERFQALIDRALPLLDYKLFRARQASSQAGELDPVAYQDAACDLLAQEPNAIVRELYAKNLADQLQTTAEAVLTEIDRRLNRPQAPARPSRRPQPGGGSPAPTDKADETVSREEFYLLGLLAADPSLVTGLDLQGDDFSPVLQPLAEEALDQARQQALTPARLLDLCQDRTIRGRPLRDLMARLAMRLDDWVGRQPYEEAAQAQLWRLRQKKLGRRLEAITKELAETADAERQQHLKDELLTVRDRLTRMKQTPGSQATQGGRP